MPINKKLAIRVIGLILIFQAILYSGLPKLFDWTAQTQSVPWDGNFTENQNLLLTGQFISYENGNVKEATIKAHNKLIRIDTTAFSDNIFYKSCSHNLGDNVTYSGFFQKDNWNYVFYVKRELC